jgi:hypothetical protein
VSTDFDTLYEYTSCIWPSFVYHSRLTICDCLRFTKVWFCPYTSEKQCDVTRGRPERLWFLVLPDCLNRLHNDSIVLRWQPKCLATTFCVSPAWSIPIARRRWFSSRRGSRQDNHIRLVHLRNRFQTSNLTARSIPGLRPISSRTVRNRLREHNIRPRRPAIAWMNGMT